MIKFIKQLFCRHSFYQKYCAPYTQKNGNRTTQIIRECSKCGKLNITTIPRMEG